jgi:hypothetical protein
MARSLIPATLGLARHIGNAIVREDSRGVRLAKVHQHSTRRIDLAVAAVMAHSIAATVEAEPQLFVF